MAQIATFPEGACQIGPCEVAIGEVCASEIDSLFRLLVKTSQRVDGSLSMSGGTIVVLPARWIERDRTISPNASAMPVYCGKLNCETLKCENAVDESGLLDL